MATRTLAEFTTMRVGGACERYLPVRTTDELVATVRETDAAGQPLLVVSGGSNLVVSDAGFPGTVVHVLTRGVTVESVDRCGGAMVRVAAGEEWDGLVRRAVAEGWAGIEALSGIPGSVGATPVQNVGAYGQEVSQTVAQVRVWDRRDRCVRTIPNADCGFGYRWSMFKADDRYVVLEVVFQLELAELSRPVGYADLATGLQVELGARVPLPMAREAVLQQRRRRGMVVDPSDPDTWGCGSFFTNPELSDQEFHRLQQRVSEVLSPDVTIPRFPGTGGSVKTSAAWLIERAGFGKGFGMPGPAAVSGKHVLAITNRGGATAAQILELARVVRDGVAHTFGVRLVNEPVLVGLQL